ncbi:YvrJ family protein [Granulicatella seriolae]|uniref:YvrJ family protein n=1 Tax=Granulicatella seriolae TaxID=2967226 RepID=A0ABT1WN94_9LACT|nr:YvrJ family protein [Granulicatella seriolae]
METTGLEMLVELLSNTGFPIVISLYLLHRMEKKLDDMIHILQQVQVSLSKNEARTNH